MFRQSINGLLPVLVLFIMFPVQNSFAYPEGMSIRSIRNIERKAARRGNSDPKTQTLEEVCPSVRDWSGALIKDAYPGHIQLSDPRASGYAMVCGNSCPRKFPAAAYYSDGTLAFKLGYYGTWEGNGRPRAYCGAGGAPRCDQDIVGNKSRKFERDGFVYVKFSKNRCLKFNPRNPRTGSPFS